MKKWTVLTALGLAGIVANPVRGDVTWQHTGVVRLGKDPKPVASFQMRNDWSGGRHRTLLSYNATDLGAGPAGYGTVSLIQRFDDDRLIWAASNDKKYFDEPLSTLAGRLRFNWWKNLDPKLSGEDIPALTLEQRQRLGAELRAATSPFTKKYLKTYFRALPERRTIQGMTTRGYRLTSLINGGEASNQGWARVTVEWWLADSQPGDDELKGWFQQAQEVKKKVGPPTVSMWLNEIFPVLWQAQPEPVLKAVESLTGRPDGPNFGFQGTPVQFYVTVTPPPAEALFGGDVRMSLELKKRNVAAIPTRAFEVPAGYKRVELEPELKKMRELFEQTQQQIGTMMP